MVIFKQNSWLLSEAFHRKCFDVRQTLQVCCCPLHLYQTGTVQSNWLKWHWQHIYII